MSDEYQLPKRRIEATVIPAGGEPRRMELFAGEHAERHAGSERPSDLLNGEGRFLPVVDRVDGFVLLRRSSVAMVTVALEDEVGVEPTDAEQQALVDPEMEGVERKDVRMVLEGGTEVTGTMALVLPPGDRRLQDLLNQAEGFVRVRNDDRLHLVSIDHVVRASPI